MTFNGFLNLIWQKNGFSVGASVFFLCGSKVVGVKIVEGCGRCKGSRNEGNGEVREVHYKDVIYPFIKKKKWIDNVTEN